MLQQNYALHPITGRKEVNLGVKTLGTSVAYATHFFREDLKLPYFKHSEGIVKFMFDKMFDFLN